jgi:hypothetical protein
VAGGSFALLADRVMPAIAPAAESEWVRPAMGRKIILLQAALSIYFIVHARKKMTLRPVARSGASRSGRRCSRRSGAATSSSVEQSGHTRQRHFHAPLYILKFSLAIPPPNNGLIQDFTAHG